jgi:tRNA pseudouridine13 synthase
LLPVSEIDKLLGIEFYATKSDGVGGVIRESPDDFVVEEVLVDGSKASVNSSVTNRVLGSSNQKQQFLLCVLVKRNWDTLIITKNVAKSLGIERDRVQFAGIKDAKAVTAQYITIENVSIEEVKRINIKGVEIHPIGYVRGMLSLFYLLGNNFKINIKSIKKSRSVVEKLVTQTKQQLDLIGGIPNFFGHQRFGTIRPITHLVGKALVQGDFENAALLFLAKPSLHEHPESNRARQELETTKNFKRAQETFPKQLRFERLMLNHLAGHPTDFVGAFRKLPDKLQALFVQAHQSYLFNRFISERVRKGLPLNEALVGDYVVGVERSGLPLFTLKKIADNQNLAEVNTQIKTGRVRVALPLFGFKQKLSKGIMGQIESEVLEQDGIDVDKLRINVLSKTGGKGGLRTLVTPIQDFRLQNVSTDSFGNSFGAEIGFKLLRGSYATVVLREIMKPLEPIIAGF